MNKSKLPTAGFRSYMSYLAQYKLRATLIGLGFMVANICLAVVPYFIGKLTGALASNPVRGHEAVLLTWLLIGLSVAHSMTWHGTELFYVRFIRPLVFSYENILFRQVIRRPYPYFVDKFTGKISSYITTLSQEFRGFLDDVFYNYISQVVSIVALVAIMISVNWQTGLVFTLGLLAMLLTGRKYARIMSERERHSSDITSTKNGKLIDAIANFANVKSFHKEMVETLAIGREQDKARAADRKSFFWSMVFWTVMSTWVRAAIWPAAIGLNVYLFLHHQIGIAQLATLLSAILLFSSTIWEAVWYVSQFSLRRARVEEAHKYLFGDVNVAQQFRADPDIAVDAPNFASNLQFTHLNFAYPDRPDVPVLRDIDLAIKKGEKIGIVGHSGSGKTTLTKLLLGYYPTEHDQLLLDSVQVDVTRLSRLISYVPQDTSLFHRSIGDNIAYATDREVSQNEIVQAAQRAHADEFIDKLLEGYETLVGERGVKLSAGQRQRIAIARAFLDDKPLLILDEATSALDSESELLVQEALENLWHNKTVIAIAHRLSTLRHMDKIVVMDSGRIVEFGSHSELLHAKGAYAKLWAHQSGGFIEE